MAPAFKTIRVRQSLDAWVYTTLTISQILRDKQNTWSRIAMTPMKSNDSLNAGVFARTWRFGEQTWSLGRFPKLMGIVNVTPDSFSDGGQFLDCSAAVEHALRLVAEGADILDIGGESTRPGATPVNVEDELQRVVPVVRELAQRTRVPISIDTTKAEVARRCLAEGAVIVNDISGLTFDADMPRVCRESSCGVIVMHIQGTPQTMQADPRYENVVREVRDHFSERLRNLEEAGICAERVVLDPGIGFGKTASHNLELLSHIAEFRGLGRPVLIGHSRKRFLKYVLGREIEERDAGTLGVSIALAAQQVDILRIHDVRATRDALLAWRTVLDPTFRPA
jgi:dihydropteroate synthase